MELGTLGQWAGVGVSLLVALAAYWRAATREDERELAELRAQAAALQTRVSGIEIQMRSLPTLQAVHDLALSVKDLAGDVRALTARMDGLDDIVDRVDEMVKRQESYLREHK